MHQSDDSDPFKLAFNLKARLKFFENPPDRLIGAANCFPIFTLLLPLCRALKNRRKAILNLIKLNKTDERTPR